MIRTFTPMHITPMLQSIMTTLGSSVSLLYMFFLLLCIVLLTLLFNIHQMIPGKTYRTSTGTSFMLGSWNLRRSMARSLNRLSSMSFQGMSSLRYVFSLGLFWNNPRFLMRIARFMIRSWLKSKNRNQWCCSRQFVWQGRWILLLQYIVLWMNSVIKWTHLFHFLVREFI